MLAQTVVAFFNSWLWFVLVRIIWLAVALSFDAWWAIWLMLGALGPELLLRRRNRQMAEADVMLKRVAATLRAQIPPEVEIKRG